MDGVGTFTSLVNVINDPRKDAYINLSKARLLTYIYKENNCDFNHYSIIQIKRVKDSTKTNKSVLFLKHLNGISTK